MSDFSARNVGESVHILGIVWAKHSRCNWEETVRYFGARKKWSSCFWLRGVGADAACTTETRSSKVLGVVLDTVKTSPAPSQSEDVMIGGCTCTKSASTKKVDILDITHERSWRNAVCVGTLGRRCNMLRRNSVV